MENHPEKSFDTDFRHETQDRIERLKSPGDIFDLFRCLDYPLNYITNPTFKRDFKGFNSAKPIREQEPDPLLDRKALGDVVVVFDAISLKDDERKEVYRAVAELAKNRLDKARSVRR
ncbi:MAG: hypothetical protein U9N12_00445 [Euryarchaeota archaeon]|nr:hypothetical protein [Euryarchaeota archaeon]